MLRLLKYFFFTVLTFIVILCLAPLFIDKEKVVEELQKIVNRNIYQNIEFDKDITLNFFPKPNIKVHNVKLTDPLNNVSSEISEVKIESSWKSLLRLHLRIEKVKIINPEIRIEEKKFSKTHKYEKILVNTFTSSFFDKLENLQNKIKNFEIINGKVFIKKGKVSHVFNNVNSHINLNYPIKFKCEANYNNYKIKNIINLSSVDKQNFKVSWQKIFDDKSELFTTGNLIFRNRKLLFEGNTDSDFINLENFITGTKTIQSLWYNKKTIVYANSVKDLEDLISLKVSIKKIKYKDYFFERTNFNFEGNNDFLKIKNLKSTFLKAKIDSDSIYDLKNNVLNGNLSFNKLKLQEAFLGFSEYDLYGGEINGKLNFKIEKDKPNNFFNIFSSGFFEGNSMVFKGINFKKVSDEIDNVSKITDILKLGQQGSFKGNSIFQKINGQFNLQNSQLKIINLSSFGPNVKIVSNGDYEVLKDYINLNNLINFKTKKYKNLPEFGIKISGKFDSLDYSFDINEIKDFLLSKGIDNILKNNKIIIDKQSIKKLFKNDDGEFFPGDIFELFLN